MLLFWKMRYFDRQSKEFKDRNLWLDTGALDCVTKTAVEASYLLEGTFPGKEMLKHRELFIEKELSSAERHQLIVQSGSFNSFCIPDYFEDENRKWMSKNEIAAIHTGVPTAVMVSAGTKQYEIDYLLSKKPEIDLLNIRISESSLRLLGYFVREYRELKGATFFKEGSGELSSSGPDWKYTLRTSVKDEEIRSFVTIFRRLYMESEDGNLIKAGNVFAATIDGHPLARWVKGAIREYQDDLADLPEHLAVAQRDKWHFSRKRLIDVFLYTQFHHQPKKDRIRQFRECLEAVKSSLPTLKWMFLSELRSCSLQIHNVGFQIERFMDLYCECHKITPDIIDSFASNIPEMGTLEKPKERRDRILREKSAELATSMWENAGRPQDQFDAFLNSARNKLSEFHPVD